MNKQIIIKLAISFWVLFIGIDAFSQTRLIKEVTCDDSDLPDSLVLDDLFKSAYNESKLNLDRYISEIVRVDSHLFHEIEMHTEIKPEFYIALSCFPEIENKQFDFRYKRIKGTMNARPDVLNLFRNRANRKYLILINNNKGHHKGVPPDELSRGAMLGWYGHELAHLQTFQMMSNLQIILFILRYVTSVVYVKKVERFTDYIAIERGLVFPIYESGQYLATYGNVTNSYKKMNVFNSLSLDEYKCLWYKLRDKTLLKSGYR